MKLLLISYLFLIGFLNLCHGQSLTSVCKINKVWSANKKFFLRSTPYDNILESMFGKTEVFSSDSVKLYEFPVYFDKYWGSGGVFLSNDGNTIVHVLNSEFTWRNKNHGCIEIYRKGKLFMRIPLKDLVENSDDEENRFLLYDAVEKVKWKDGKREITYKEGVTDFQKHISDTDIYYRNDSLLIFLCSEKVMKMDMNTGTYTKDVMSNYSLESLSGYMTFSCTAYKFNNPTFDLPALQSGEKFEEGVAKFLGMKVFPEYSKKANKYCSHKFYVEVVLDSTGVAAIDSIKNYDSINEKEVLKFVTGSKFKTTYVPKGIEKWRFRGWVSLMNKSNRKAKIEKKLADIKAMEEYEKRIVADSIEGVYIPKNIEECFTELDKELRPKDKDIIKNLTNCEETIQFHHGLGTWIRNNWGLWGGSRLREYLKMRGLFHPDSMSALILELYWDWLHNIPDKWKEFDSTIKAKRD